MRLILALLLCLSATACSPNEYRMHKACSIEYADPPVFGANVQHPYLIGDTPALSALVKDGWRVAEMVSRGDCLYFLLER